METLAYVSAVVKQGQVPGSALQVLGLPVTVGCASVSLSHGVMLLLREGVALPDKQEAQKLTSEPSSNHCDDFKPSSLRLEKGLVK